MAKLIIPDLAGKVFLVTGASTGIGAAVARALAAQGAAVAVHYNASEQPARALAGEIAAAGGNVFLIAGDVTKPETAAGVVEGAATHFGRLDGLINNAGSMLGRVPVAKSDETHDRAVLDLNAHSVVWASRAALPWLRREGGVVINTTFIAARQGGGGERRCMGRRRVSSAPSPAGSPRKSCRTASA